MHLLQKFRRGQLMTAVKKSETCSATLHLTNHPDIEALKASLIGEEAAIESAGDVHSISISAPELSELRAKLNTILRSLQAASDSLIEVDHHA